ncbi:uncharacterized protein LOC144162747 isoform X3 [Haemaphysalis longicornis]
MCCSDDDALRWVVLVRLFYGNGFGSTWEYAFTIHSMNVRRIVRTTSVILLLGVGSFVCYKLYCQLRQRFRKRKKSKRETVSLRKAHVRNWISDGRHGGGIQERCLESDNESDITESSLQDTSQASFGDIPKPVTEHAQAEKKCDGSSSCGGGFLSDEDIWDMGVTSSNPYEPVRFDNQSGDVRFEGSSLPKSSTPLNIARKGHSSGGGLHHRNRKTKLEENRSARQNKSNPKAASPPKAGSGSGDFASSIKKHNNNNNEDRAPLSDDSISQDPEGLLDSLSYEGGGESTTPWATNDTVSLLANFSIGSLSERNRRTEELISSRVADSQDEETDEFSVGGNGGMVSDSALLRLRNSHSRQLSADSEASDLSIFEQAQAPHRVPCEAFETIDKIETILHDTKQELLDLDADLVSLRVFQKLPQNYDVVLDDSAKAGAQRRGSIRNASDHLDSGSDFGNSLESDSERLAKESSGPSLEWDSLNLSKRLEERRGSDSTDFGGLSELSETGDVGPPQGVLGVVRRHSSGNIQGSAGTLREQIQRILYTESESWKRQLVRSQTLPVDQSLPESERDCAVALGPTKHEPIPLNKMTTVPEENTPSPSSASEFASFAASSDRDASMDTNGNDLMDVRRDHTVSESESDDGPFVSVEDRVSLADYILGLCHKNRHGRSDGAEKSLAAVLSGLDVRSLRRVRNDGYAAIRAAGFQILATGGSILAGQRGANGVYQRFHDSESKPWLEKWTFHRRLRYTQSLQGFWDCLSSLQDLEDQLRVTANPESLLASRLNADPVLDAKVVEAIKIVMLKSALELLAAQRDSDAPCPMFATVLFSQVPSTSPEGHLADRISRLGRDRPVPEAELYLLGYALATTLTIVRPGRTGSDDYVCRYPEWQLGSWPESVLVENDGHYWACAT